jgi:hypothetical protein
MHWQAPKVGGEREQGEVRVAGRDRRGHTRGCSTQGGLSGDAPRRPPRRRTREGVHRQGRAAMLLEEA